MGLTILASGIPHHVLFGNETIEISPFIAIDNQGTPDLVLAILYAEENAEIFRFHPNNIIQAWRAMLVLEQVAEINSSTLSSAWFMANQQEDSYQQHSNEILKVFPGTARQLNEILKTIYTSVPKPIELDQMISTMQDLELNPSSYELEVEIEAKRITRTPLINAIHEEVEEKRQATKNFKKK